jgi:hypothetical protein
MPSFFLMLLDAFPAKKLLRAFVQDRRWALTGIAYEQFAVRRELDFFCPVIAGQHRGIPCDLNLELKTVRPLGLEGAILLWPIANIQPAQR